MALINKDVRQTLAGPDEAWYSMVDGDGLRGERVTAS